MLLILLCYCYNFAWLKLQFAYKTWKMTIKRVADRMSFYGIIPCLLPLHVLFCLSDSCCSWLLTTWSYFSLKKKRWEENVENLLQCEIRLNSTNNYHNKNKIGAHTNTQKWTVFCCCTGGHNKKLKNFIATEKVWALSLLLHSLHSIYSTFDISSTAYTCCKYATDNREPDVLTFSAHRCFCRYSHSFWFAAYK